ncbi:hypothetical protein OEA41_009710 [Lepraria neglecta]|uniref:Heterokaryon incompatibility domain-containing protein n=1 Tax=Lepraria neglecta TaxID=209136 RepID=A0AAE0DKG6_9LECA|nr:hypothetical protein OEA41_009710 [Lepraria neglecta]
MAQIRGFCPTLRTSGQLLAVIFSALLRHLRRRAAHPSATVLPLEASTTSTDTRRGKLNFDEAQSIPPNSTFYTSIPKHNSKIRIIELLGGDDVNVHCKMHMVDLEGVHALTIEGKRRTYEALSYTWHSQTLSHILMCDGKALQVTQSLYDALRTLQDEHTAPAFQLIDTIITKHVSPDVSLKADPEAIWAKEIMDAMRLPRFPSFEWEALAKLFERTYFRRIWVVQEIVVTSNAVIRCGSLTISWEYVEYMARSLLATGWVRALKQVYGFNVIPNFVQTISNIKASFSELKGGRGVLLSLLLSASRSFQATDPRDKIIALAGLSDHRSLGSSASTLLDYSKAVEDLYIEVTAHLMRRERSLNLLSSVEDISDRTMNLPSWVPNYRVWQRHTILGSSIRVAHLNFNAAGRTKVSASWASDGRVLAVDGYTYDTIENVSVNSLDRQIEDKEVILEWLQVAEPLIRRGIIGIEAFWRTLIGDQGSHIFPAPEQYGTHFESYLFHAKARNQGYPKTPKIRKSGDVPNAAHPLVYQAALGYVAPNRKFLTTTKGLIGLGPHSMQPGDLICIMSGGRVPYVLRKEGGHCRLIGESYVHGLMEGQAIQKGITFRSFLIH